MVVNNGSLVVRLATGEVINEICPKRRVSRPGLGRNPPPDVRAPPHRQAEQDSGPKQQYSRDLVMNPQAGWQHDVDVLLTKSGVTHSPDFVSSSSSSGRISSFGVCSMSPAGGSNPSASAMSSMRGRSARSLSPKRIRN